MCAWNPHTTITLPTDCRSRFYGLAFDGCFFYLTAPHECSIYKFKRDFTMHHAIKTDKPYSCICYDCKENCFWVTEKKHTDSIYKLDDNMKEICPLWIKNCQRACSSVIGLTYDCEKDTLLVAYKDHIVQVTKESGRTCVIQESNDELYTAILSIAPYYAIVRQNEKEQSFRIFNSEGHKVKSFSIPALYNIKDVLFYPCNERSRDALEFILLATKNDCHQNILLKVTICDMELCGCNYSMCRRHCGEAKEAEHCICDVIESVALIETSLSHILNAEGEKLQKAVELAESIDELLTINRSVTRTIINITQLEHNLYLKLDALNDLRKNPICNNEESK